MASTGSTTEAAVSDQGRGAPQTKADPLVGRTIAGRYEVLELLGAGGMGTVYKARQVAMDRLVALKLLHAHYASNEQAVARFNREMQVTARIEHANTIRVYDYGQTEDQQLYLAVEFLRGRTLKDAIVSDEPMGTERLARIGIQIAKGLAAAHHDGVVHRDLKPDNVMLIDHYGESDFVKVLDFGIARFNDDEARTQLTADGAVIGTPAYMSPEQAQGTTIDHRTDIYSFGVILFEMATGRIPFDAPTTISLMVQHVQEAPPRPSELAPGQVCEELETLILQMLAKNPAARPQSALEVQQALEVLAGGAAPSAGPSVPMKRGASAAGDATRPARDGVRIGAGGGRRAAPRWWRRPGPLAGLVIGLGAAAAGIILALGGGEQSAGSPAPGDRVAAIGGEGGDEAAPPAGEDPSNDPPVTADGQQGTPPGGEQETPPGDERPPDEPTGVDRGPLVAALAEVGDPVPPAACEADDPALVEGLSEALLELAGGRIGGERPEDRRALERLEAMSAIGEGRAEYWVAVARARLQAGENAATARAAATRAIALCDGWAAGHNAAGNAHLRSGDGDLARIAYSRAVELEPSYIAPRFNLGVLHLRGEAFDEAIAAFGEVLVRAPEHPTARLLRGQAYLRRGDGELAMRELTAAVELSPDSANAWLLLGQARAAVDEDAASTVAFCKARELGAPVPPELCPEGQ